MSTRGVIFVHSSPTAVCPHVEWAISGVLGTRVSLEWTAQPAAPGLLRTECTWSGPAGRRCAPQLDALVAVVVGYTDWVVDAVAVRVVGGDALRIAEAVRRQRVETTGTDSFVEQLLGIRIGDDQVARGKAFAKAWSTGPAKRDCSRCSNGLTPCRPQRGRRPRALARRIATPPPAD